MCFYHVAILVLISHIDTEKDLYCPYKTLIKSYENPSAFCQVSGKTVFAYGFKYLATYVYD